MAKETKNLRSYNWCFETYENPIEVLKDKALKIAVSPCHDKDKKEDGTLKKPHWHCIVHYENAVTENRVIKDFGNIGANCHYEAVSSKVAYEEYLTHSDGHSLDDQNKYKYDVNDVVKLGGYEFGYSTKGNDEKLNLFDLLFEYITADQVNGEINGDLSIVGFSSFIRLKNPQLISVLMKNSYYIINYLKEYSK